MPQRRVVGRRRSSKAGHLRGGRNWHFRGKPGLLFRTGIMQISDAIQASLPLRNCGLWRATASGGDRGECCRQSCCSTCRIMQELLIEVTVVPFCPVGTPTLSRTAPRGINFHVRRVALRSGHSAVTLPPPSFFRFQETGNPRGPPGASKRQRGLIRHGSGSRAASSERERRAQARRQGRRKEEARVCRDSRFSEVHSVPLVRVGFRA